jgi:hypothetical protein
LAYSPENTEDLTTVRLMYLSKGNRRALEVLGAALSLEEL